MNWLQFLEFHLSLPSLAPSAEKVNIMPRFIYFLPISLILHACGGGNIDEMTEEELSQYPSQSIQEQHNEMIGIPTKTIIPVSCIDNPHQCI